jgi:hypothetical protein
VRQQKLLPGPFGSSESRTAFARLQLELEASPAPAVPDREKLTIVELMLAYLDHAERHYRTPAGKPTSELFEVKVVIRALRELYADTPVSEFGPLARKAARQKWVNEGRSRTECNRRVGMVKRIFKWAASEELAPPAVYHALATVTGLQKERTVAPETKPVGPVDDAVVDATLLVAAARGLLGGGRRWGALGARCDDRTGASEPRPVWSAVRRSRRAPAAVRRAARAPALEARARRRTAAHRARERVRWRPCHLQHHSARQVARDGVGDVENRLNRRTRAVSMPSRIMANWAAVSSIPAAVASGKWYRPASNRWQHRHKP